MTLVLRRIEKPGILSLTHRSCRMKITNLKTNRIPNPLGYTLGQPSLSWLVEDTPDKVQVAAQVMVASDPDFQDMIFDSGKVSGSGIDSLAYQPQH